MKIKPVNIALKEGAVPYSVSIARRLSVPMLSKVKEELNFTVVSDVITEIKESIEWYTSVVPIPKKNTEQLRICINLK